MKKKWVIKYSQGENAKMPITRIFVSSNYPFDNDGFRTSSILSLIEPSVTMQNWTNQLVLYDYPKIVAIDDKKAMDFPYYILPDNNIFGYIAWIRIRDGLTEDDFILERVDV